MTPFTLDALAGVPLPEAGRNLAVYIPAAVPRCCARCAVNHVRHNGTLYDALRLAQGRRLCGLEYLEFRGEVDARVRAELMHAGRLPHRERCTSRPFTRAPQQSFTSDTISEQTHAQF